MIESFIHKIYQDLISGSSVIDRNVTYFSAVAAFIVCIVMYVFLVSRFLPHFLLTPSRSKCRTDDRGIKKYVFPEGRAVVYEPKLSYRRYVSKYALFEYNGSKYIKLKLCENVSKAECEIVFFDNKNKPVKIMKYVFENVDGQSESVVIPYETSYAGITLIGVNGERVSDAPSAKLSVPKQVVFTVLTTVLTVAVGVLIRAAVIFMADMLFSYFQYGQADGFDVTIIVSAVIGVLISFLGAKLYSVKRRGK